MKSVVPRYIGAVLLALSYNLLYLVLSPITVLGSFVLLDPFYNVALVGTELIFDSVTFSFIPACIAVSAYLFLGALILFTRGIGWRLALKMFAIGSGAIFLANLMRILFLVWVYVQYGRNIFESLHFSIWFLVSTVFIAGLWIGLVKYYEVKGVPVYSDLKAVLDKNY